MPFSLVFKKFQVGTYVPKKNWWVSIFIVLTGVIVIADDIMPFLFPKTQWSSSWKWIWKWPEIIHHQKCPLLNGPMWEQFLIEDLYSSCCDTLLEKFSETDFFKKNTTKLISNLHMNFCTQIKNLNSKWWCYEMFQIQTLLISYSKLVNIFFLFLFFFFFC